MRNAAVCGVGRLQQISSRDNKTMYTKMHGKALYLMCHPQENGEVQHLTMNVNYPLMFVVEQIEFQKETKPLTAPKGTLPSQPDYRKLDKHTGRNGVHVCLVRFTCPSWLDYFPTPQRIRYPDHVWLFSLSSDGLECAGVRCDDRFLADRHQPLLPRNPS